MGKLNNQISSFQVFLIGAMIGNGLFVGMGNIITVQIARENTWLVALISVFIGIIPVLLLSKIVDYLPSLNILDKNKKIFGKYIGHLFNFLIMLIMMATLIMLTWGVTNFAGTKYLNETPFLFIAVLFMIPTIYASIKGIEAIARTIHIVFFLSLIIHFIITSSLINFVEIENIKPILAHGYEPIIEAVLKFITYCFTPFMALLIIPKDAIEDKKNLKKCILGGYMLAALFMAHVFFINMSVVGINIASLYRYPEYYVIKKVSIGSAFDNIENFLSAHWIFNMLSAMFLCLYFVKEYFKNLFKIKKEKIHQYMIIVVALIAAYISTSIFPTSTAGNNFMLHKFPIYFGLTAIIILFITNIAIRIKNIKSKQSI